jgi:hypothetical protein
MGAARSLGGPRTARRAWSAHVRAAAACLAGCLAAGASACELQEITVVEFADVVVAEVYATLRQPPAESSVVAFVHGTTAGGRPDSRTFDDALVRVSRSDGTVIDLTQVPIEGCLLSVPDNAGGTCFVADPALAAQLRSGDVLDLLVTLGGGAGSALGSLTLPGDFALVGLGAQCRLPADTTLDVSWTRSDGAWAYINETIIEGLPEALESEGIQATDSLYLLGLSVSEADTTVVFPSQFGVFDRFDLDQDLAARLQRGLPDQTSAKVSIAAVERNYVNWVRGGSFNPSGLVRVSSLRGAATGVFGGVSVRDFVVLSSAGPITGVPDCP